MRFSQRYFTLAFLDEIRRDCKHCTMLRFVIKIDFPSSHTFLAGFANEEAGVERHRRAKDTQGPKDGSTVAAEAAAGESASGSFE